MRFVRFVVKNLLHYSVRFRASLNSVVDVRFSVDGIFASCTEFCGVYYRFTQMDAKQENTNGEVFCLLFMGFVLLYLCGSVCICG